MKIELTNEESEEFFYNSLCNSLGYMSGYGLELEFDIIKYKEAQAKLTNPCYEDVLMQLLRDGNELTLVDVEGEGDMTRSINIQDVHERVKLTSTPHLIDMVQENDDATTGDVIIQTVFYSDVIFG